MAFTTDYTTPIGMVRLLITDLDSTNPIFPDDNQINAFLSMEYQQVKLAAALAFETIAGNRALTLQCIQLLDLKTDGLRTSQAFLGVAQRLRDTDNEDWAGFTFAQVTDDSMFVYREYLTKQLIAMDSGCY